MGLQHIFLKEIHIIVAMACNIIHRKVVIKTPIKVVSLSSLALHHERMLTEVLIERGCPSFLRI